MSKIHVQPIEVEVNASFITRYVSPEFNARNKSRSFDEGVYAMFPELQGKITSEMSMDDIYAIVLPVVTADLKKHEAGIQEKIIEIQEEFDHFIDKLVDGLYELFELENQNEMDHMKCYVGHLPRFPRNVMTKVFFVSFEAEEIIYTGAVHEINHFYCFEKWKTMHGYNLPREPYHPEPLWFLQELIVDPTLNEPMIQRIAPYEQKAYPQFYNQSINGKPLMNYIKEFYQERKSMADFLDRSYDFIEKNIVEIRQKCG